MSHHMMVLEQERTSQLVKGWSLSIALHGCLILAIMVAMPKLTLTLEKEPFRWDVALVDTPSPTPAVPAAAPPERPPAPSKQAPAKQQPARLPEPTPPIVTKQVQPQEAVQPIRREVEPVQRETQPVEPKIETVQRDLQSVQQEPQPIVEAERPGQQAEPAREVVAMQKTEQQEITKPEAVIDQPVAAEAVREISPAVEQRVTQAAPVPLERRDAPAPVINPSIPEARPEPEVMARAPVIETPPAMAVEKPTPAEPAAVTRSSEPAPAAPSPTRPDAIEPPSIQSAPATTDSPAPAVQEQAPVVARSITPNPAKKADYGWLAESLHRRIVELRHYPSTARLNGWEGKVVLRVQIRQDGNLESVSVVKSSGHETLDNAAMEAVRRATPLHLKHELTSPMVVVQVPINYSLNR